MTHRFIGSAVLAALFAAGCATTLPSSQELDQQAQAAIKASFRDEGIAKVDRINQDLGQAACSSDKAPSADVAKRVEAEALATIRPPSGGRYLGNWREGEKLAQNGRGMTWTDASASPKSNGGNCYNCHQIDQAEISFGTIGPSLWNYGKLRGVKDPADPASAAIVQYTCDASKTHQQWTLEQVGDGSGAVRIKVAHSGKCVDVWDASQDATADATQYTCSATKFNQQFLVETTATGTMKFRARHSGQCLEIAGRNSANKSHLHQNWCSTHRAQEFSIG